MKKILGLDIGTTSIGWAIVEATAEKKVNEKTNDVAATDINNDRIGIHKDAVGVRIISQDTANILSFNKGEKLIQGSTLTPTANRRAKRGSRRLKSRYKLRRGKLNNVLSFLNIVRDEKYYTNERKNDTDGKRIKRGEYNDIGKAIYELRDRAIRDNISLSELGRILLHLNQWRGYSSDKFAIEEKPKFDYFIAEILEVDFENKISHFDKDKKEDLRYYQIEAKLKFEEPYNLGDSENPKFVSELSGFIFKKEIDFKPGNFITIKAPEFRQDKKGKHIVSEYYKFTLTTPDPTDWNYKYQTLQKTLTEWCNEGKTLGSYFYHNFYENKNIDRIRNNVVNRKWYEQEFDKIWELQFENHKNFFEKIDIEEVVKVAFKDYQAILNEVKKQDGIKEQLKCLIKDKIIFFQRPWQQAKNKGQCLFEKILVKKEQTIKGTGKKEMFEVHIGRTVIPRSHPLFQEFKIWQQINNVRLYLNTANEKIDLFADADVFKTQVGKEIPVVKQMLFEALQKAKTVSWRTFVKDELALNTFEDLESEFSKTKSRKEGVDSETGEVSNTYFSVNFRKRVKDQWKDIPLKGNTTKASLKNILINKDDNWFHEQHSKKQQISNLQLLWEIIYDITNSDAVKVAEIIKRHFDFGNEICLHLAKVKFDDAGMGNLSAKAIRHILPMMSNGKSLSEKAKKKIDSLIALNQSEEEKAKDKDEKLEGLKNFVTDKKARLRLSQFSNKDAFTYLNYWEATAVMYGSHSSKNTITKSAISRVENHSMNNPVVEKIVNETVSIVNEIYKQYGFDEVRIELSRELKASMDERQQMHEAMTANAEKNEWAKQMLRELKKALIEDNRDTDNIDNSTSTNSNLDKIKIIEDVVTYQYKDEYKKKFKEFKLDEPSKSEITKYLLWLEQNFKCPYTDQPIPLTDVFARGNVVEIEHIIPRERYYLNSYANKVITWREVNQAKSNNGNRTAYEFIDSKRVEDKIKVGNRELPLVAKEKWEEHIKAMFPKGGKRSNLLRKEIPEDPINRTLNETQFINKKLKEKLSELVGEQKVWVTSGAVTDILRERWHLNNIMKELMRNRFENFEMPTGKKTFSLKTVEEQEGMIDKINHVLKAEPFEIFKIPFGQTGNKFIEIKEVEELQLIQNDLQNLIRENIESSKKPKPYKYESSKESTESKNLTYWTKEYNSKTNEYKAVEKFEGFSKRLDHRHHAMDAIIIACTKQNHVQYINSLNAINSADQENDESKKAKYTFIKNDVCISNSSKKFFSPWNNDKFIVDVKNAMDNVIVSHKNTRLLISPSKNKFGTSKVASIRGELHKETNYAKKNYFEDGVNERVSIKKLIPFLLDSKMKNQLQSMVLPKDFKEVIQETIFKEKYQKVLIPLFQKHEKDEKGNEIKLTAALCDKISTSILNEIAVKKLLIYSKTNEPIEWLSTFLIKEKAKYVLKDKAARPKGLSMNLNIEDILSDKTGIADPRIKRLAGYRLAYVNKQKKEIDNNTDLSKPEKDKKKREVETLPLFSNAIYEVRVKRNTDKFDWVEIKDFDWNDFDKIEYTKQQKIDLVKTDLVKKKLKEIGSEKLKEIYFDNPIFLSPSPILIKKVRQKAWVQDLYEINKGKFVDSSDMFMTYFFKNKNTEKQSGNREWRFLKYLDAVRIISVEKPNKIDYTKLIEQEKINAELLNDVKYELLFTLAKNDLVYLPSIDEEIENIDWNNINSISSKLFIVKDMNPSQDKIIFQQFYKSDSINISEADAKSLFKNFELKEQTEKIKDGVKPLMQNCIKVFTDKLGKRIVPYWNFPNGCWNKEIAQNLGLIW